MKSGNSARIASYGKGSNTARMPRDDVLEAAPLTDRVVITSSRQCWHTHTPKLKKDTKSDPRIDGRADGRDGKDLTKCASEAEDQC